MITGAPAGKGVRVSSESKNEDSCPRRAVGRLTGDKEEKTLLEENKVHRIPGCCYWC